MASPPWPHMDDHSALSALLQEDHHHHHQMQAPPSLAASQSSSSPSPAPAPLATSVAKPGKRKSRTLAKPPIRVLSADKESFRDLVQKLTGIPSSPHIARQAGMQALPPSIAACQSPAFAHQTMPTLDTSAAYLARRLRHGPSSVLDGAGKRQKTDFYEMGYGREDLEVPSAAFVSGPISYGEGFNQASDGFSELESFLMSSSKVEELMQARIDPWLTPYVEISHSA